MWCPKRRVEPRDKNGHGITDKCNYPETCTELLLHEDRNQVNELAKIVFALWMTLNIWRRFSFGSITTGQEILNTPKYRYLTKNSSPAFWTRCLSVYIDILKFNQYETGNILHKPHERALELKSFGQRGQPSLYHCLHLLIKAFGVFHLQRGSKKRKMLGHRLMQKWTGFLFLTDRIGRNSLRENVQM